MTREPGMHRPRTTVGRVLEELGSTLLQHVSGPEHPELSIEAVVIHDPEDELDQPDRALVLGVGLRDSARIHGLIARLGERGAAGLVLRAPVTADPTMLSAAHSAGVTVLSLTRGVSWGHLAGTLGVLMTPSDPDDARPASFGGIPAGDLFAVANSIAALLQAPVTIEDRHSRLLAFSSVQEGADASRIQTILGRQVPAQYTRFLEESGVFQAIYRSERPVTVAPLPREAGAQPEEQARAVIAVRAGEEILGTIWVASPAALNPAQEQILIDSSRLVAMHLIWQRTDADLERRHRAQLLGAALDGGPGAQDAARALRLREEPAVVLALALDVPDGSQLSHAHLAAERKRVADAFAVHLAFAHPQAASGLIGDIAYGVIPLSAADSDDSGGPATRFAGEFIARVRSPLRALIGIGRAAAGPGNLTFSRSGADRALRVLRSPLSDRSTARFEDVHAEALLLELPAPAAEFPSGAIARLAAYDADHQASLIDTLRAWLDAFGDVSAASAAVYVHPNTFRYRLKRVTEVGGIDLADPDARFAAMLQLRLLALSRAR
ncbi:MULTISPECIES: PucR family transcriptional regulator [Arthrobacter]|uniref:Helix-turn-helix domain-containing protein n=2 Tax=Arthrobacter TaxID=1663 RepID=A0ABU9KLD4_9MICC|nr:PucR family transcriptional regulator [Arthrobacter sp. YJM1]MDP5226285.1 helix-turn-helix domain-containing protein [Arthrobacter sp. YJM1]